MLLRRRARHGRRGHLYKRQFRIKHTYHSYLIGNVLDLGQPAGIEVPQVEEPATVVEALKYFYYPQQGKRSSPGREASAPVARWKIEDG